MTTEQRNNCIKLAVFLYNFFEDGWKQGSFTYVGRLPYAETTNKGRADWSYSNNTNDLVPFDPAADMDDYPNQLSVIGNFVGYTARATGVARHEREELIHYFERVTGILDKYPADMHKVDLYDAANNGLLYIYLSNPEWRDRPRWVACRLIYFLISGKIPGAYFGKASTVITDFFNSGIWMNLTLHDLLQHELKRENRSIESVLVIEEPVGV